MLVKSESIIVNTNRLLYILADPEKGIGEIGLSLYDHQPIKLTVSPENALALSAAWFDAQRAEEEFESQIISRRRPRRRTAHKAVKKGAKK